MAGLIPVRLRLYVLCALTAFAVFDIDAEAPRSSTREALRSLPYDTAALKSGDVIFRAGIGLTSRLVLSADRDARYSHAGLAANVNGALWVIHVEPEQDHHLPAVVKMEPLGVFLAGDRASSAAVHRALSISTARIEKAVATARTYVTNRVPFDSRFDLSSVDRLYCTELVWRAYLAAGVDLVDGSFDYPTSPLALGAYVFPSRLERSRWLTRIHTIATKE